MIRACKRNSFLPRRPSRVPEEDPDLKRYLLVGIAVWLLIEAVFSVRLGAWFNVGVDAAVMALFSVRLIANGRET